MLLQPSSILLLLPCFLSPGAVWITIYGPLASLQNTRLPSPQFRPPIRTSLQNSRHNFPTAFLTSFPSIPQTRLSPSLKTSSLLSSQQTHALSKHLHSRSVVTQPAKAGDRKSPMLDSFAPKATKSPGLASSPLTGVALPGGLRPHMLLAQDELAGHLINSILSGLSLLATFYSTFPSSNTFILTSVLLLFSAFLSTERMCKPFIILD